MATIVGAAGGGNFTAGGTWVGGVAPTAADDAQLTGTSGNVTIDSGAVCRSLSCTGYTGTLTHTSGVTFNIGDATAGLLNNALLLVSGMTYTLGNATSSAITFKSTSATQQTITTGGKTLGNVTINGSGSSYQLQDNYTSSGSFTYSSGTTFDTNSKTMTLNGASPTFAGGGKTYFQLNLTGSGTATVTGTNTFTNFNRTGTAVFTDVLTISANQTITGVWTLAGNSVTNRLLVQSSTLGTARTITNTGVTHTWSNVDFADIALGTSFNASAITGNSGDCLGNSNITFTTSATQTWSGTSGGNTSTNAWTTRVPLPQDDVVFSSAFTASQTVVQDMPRAGRTINWTGSTGSPLWTNSGGLTIYGSLTLASGMGIGTPSAITYAGRGSHTITSNGVSMFVWQWTFNQIGGTYTLGDACTNGGVNHNYGTFNSGNFNMSIAYYASNNGNVRSVIFGTSTITVTGSPTIWVFSNLSNLTFSASSSTIVMQNQATQFNAGALTYGTLTIASTGQTGVFTIAAGGSASFDTINFTDSTVARTLRFNASDTITIRNAFNVNGASGRLISIDTNSAGTATTLTKTLASGPVNLDYVSIKDSTATGGAPWYAGSHSTNVSGNTGWVFAGLGFFPSSTKMNIIQLNNLAPNSVKQNIKTTYYSGYTYDWKPSTNTNPEGKNRGFNS